MKVAIVHHTLAALGGGERVFAFLVHALNREGIVPDVYATDPEQPGKISEIFGVDVEYNLKKVWFPRVRMFGLYQRVFAGYFSLRLDGYDVIYNTTGIFSPIRVNKYKYVLYVYNPMVTKDGEFIEDTAGADKYRKGFWKLYFKPFKWLIKHAIRNLAKSSVTICAVSDYTREKIEKYWGLSARTIYPPVDTEKFSSVWDNMKRDGVILIGRYTPEKKHHLMVEIAKKMRDVRFRLVGNANTPYYQRYYNYIRSLVEEHDLKNVEVYANVPFKDLVELLGESKVLVHALENEDFGLTPAEGICGGVLPVVHASGGLREVVPFDDLWFWDRKDLYLLLRQLMNIPYIRMRPRVEVLRKHVERNFSAERFMHEILQAGGVI